MIICTFISCFPPFLLNSDTPHVVYHLDPATNPPFIYSYCRIHLEDVPTLVMPVAQYSQTQINFSRKFISFLCQVIIDNGIEYNFALSECKKRSFDSFSAAYLSIF